MKNRLLTPMALCAAVGISAVSHNASAGVSVRAAVDAIISGGFDSETTNSGLVAAQTATSNPWATASASGNSANGVLRASGWTIVPTSRFDYASVVAAVTLNDTLAFAGSSAFNGLMRVTLLGDLFDPEIEVTQPENESTAVASFGLQTTNGITGGGGSRYMFTDACAQPTCVQGTRFHEVVEVPFSVTADRRNIFFEAVLQVGSTYGGSADFGHSAYFQLLDVPAGVSFTSATGFLSDPTPIPGSGPSGLPEPSVLELALMGLAITVVSAKARRFS